MYFSCLILIQLHTPKRLGTLLSLTYHPPKQASELAFSHLPIHLPSDIYPLPHIYLIFFSLFTVDILLCLQQPSFSVSFFIVKLHSSATTLGYNPLLVEASYSSFLYQHLLFLSPFQQNQPLFLGLIHQQSPSSILPS